VALDEYRDPIMWSRLGMSDEDWKDICQRFGKDPHSETFELWNARFVEPAGATQSPQEPLTKLIAIYILTGLPLESLLGRLHFAPETVNEAELRRHIEGEIVKKRRNGKTSTQHIPGLKTKAAQVAKLICGGTLRQGPLRESCRRMSRTLSGIDSSVVEKASPTTRSIKNSKRSED
jgi:hypothetical protein